MRAIDMLRGMLLRDVQRVSERVPERLRLLREGRGLSLAQLADYTGLSTSTLSRLENGKQTLTADVLLRLSREYGLSVDFILGAGFIGEKSHPAPISEGESTWTLSSESFSFRHPVNQVIAAHKSEPVPHRHSGEEWIFVSRGQVHIEVGTEDIWVDEGESVEIDAGLSHRVVNLHHTDAVLLRKFTPHGFNNHLNTHFSEYRDDVGREERERRRGALVRSLE